MLTRALVKAALGTSLLRKGTRESHQVVQKPEEAASFPFLGYNSLTPLLIGHTHPSLREPG